MGDAYECLGPIQDNVPDAPPEPPVPSADAPAAAAPLRDDGIDLNSNPLSNKETEKGKGSGVKGKTSKEQKTPKSQMTGTQSAPLTLKNEKNEKGGKKKDRKGKGKGKGKKVSKEELKKQAKYWMVGFIASTLLFGICLALLIFIAGHRWFGISTISAIAFE